MKNRRKEIRLNEENKVTYRIISKDKMPIDDNTYYAFTENISSSGIKLLTNRLLEKGTQLKIELSLGRGNKTINLLGEVKWVKHLYDGKLFATGVEFEDNQAKNIMNIMEHVFRKE